MDDLFADLDRLAGHEEPSLDGKDDDEDEDEEERQLSPDSESELSEGDA
jgi:hypothetical protein